MGRLHEPESEAVGLIEGEIALDPRRCFVSRLGAWVEAHLILVGDHCGKGAEVGFLELAQSRPGGESPSSVSILANRPSARRR